MNLKDDDDRGRGGPDGSVTPRYIREKSSRNVGLVPSKPAWRYLVFSARSSFLTIRVSDQTVGNVLKRHGIAPAPKRSQSTTWKEFIRSHMAVLAGMDFFTVEVLSWRGLVTYYVLFFIHL